MPLALRPVGEGGGELDSRRAHVAGDEHRAGPVALGGEAGERGADATGALGVELVRNRAPDVVGLEDGVEGDHGASQPSAAGSPT